MSKISTSQTTARISAETHILLLELKGLLIAKYGQNLTSDAVLKAALELAKEDLKKRRSQLTLEL